MLPVSSLTPSLRMDLNSVYLWVLPMFHAGGWTYPWAATFAVSTQITLRNVSYPLIWNHLCNSSVTHYCGAPTVQVKTLSHPRAQRQDFDASRSPIDRARQLPWGEEAGKTRHCHHRRLCPNGSSYFVLRKDRNQPCPCLWSHVSALPITRNA